MSKQKDQPPAIYDSNSIVALKGLAPVRVRPAMYIGDTGKRGLHHLVVEVLDNSVDEAMGGHCNLIKVLVHEDGETITIEDNGRGIPVDIHAEEGVSTLQVVLTVLHAGGKFGGSGYEAAGGLHGVGVSCVNALSSHLTARIWRDSYKKDDGTVVEGGEFVQDYERGEPLYDCKRVGNTRKRGTSITFRADDTIFTNGVEFDDEVLCRRMKEIAFLNAGLTIHFSNKKTGRTEVFEYSGGIKDYVSDLNAARTDHYPDEPFFMSASLGKIQVQVAMQYSAEDQEVLLSFANNINTSEGGTHLAGFRSAITRVVNTSARQTGVLKEKDSNLTGDDVREGLTAIISVRIPQPQFEGQTKTKLGSQEAEGAVTTLFGEALKEYFDKNPSVLKQIVERAALAAKARAAAKKQAEVVKRQSFLGKSGRLPGKLSDCDSEKKEHSELFLVEGDSAAGSSKGGRDPHTQAILPIRGKIINAEKHDLAKLLANEEVTSLINSIGGGWGDDFNLNDVRYGKIIIMVDADDDGSHIATLLLAFFHRYMRPLIESGSLYLAKPPLYRVMRGKQAHYLHTDRDLEVYKKKHGESVELTRYKGLGEMNAEELGETTMKKGARQLTRVTLTDAENAFRMLDILMGSNINLRKEHIAAKTAQREN